MTDRESGAARRRRAGARWGLRCGAAAWVCLGVGAATARGGTAEQILKASGVRGGLVVHLGCGDPGTAGLTAALHANDSYLVHGLDTDPSRVEAVRRQIHSLGLHGPVSAEAFAGGRLPYVDNLVNLVVVGRACGTGAEEIARVLAPDGVAMVSADAGGLPAGAGLQAAACDLKGWSRLVKPRPGTIDEWTHFLRDATGNAVARDEQVGPPRGIQWTAGPKRTRDHDALASLSAMTSSNGRVFYILDEGQTSMMHRPPDWKLIARDAFNGVLLWKRDIPTWVTHLYYFRSGPAQLPRRLVSVGDRVYVTLGLDAPVSVLDAATGRTLNVLAGSEKAEEIVHHDGTLLAVLGDPEILDDEAPKVFGYWELSVRRKPTVEKALAAYHAETGKPLWKKTGEDLAHLAVLSLIAIGEKVLYLDSESLHCLALADGKELWRSPFPTEGLFLRNYAPTVVAWQDVVLCLTWDRLHAFSATDGRKLWQQKGAMGLASPADLFVINDLVWTIPLTSSISKDNKLDRTGKIASGVPIPTESFLGNGGKEIWGLDVHTGELKRSFARADVLPGGHHHRCYRNKATVRYLLCGRRGLEYVDLTGGEHVSNWWLRGICQYGVMPANGLIYVPPDPCQCFNLIKLNGFLALAAGSSLDRTPPGAEQPLQQGPAYARTLARKPARPAPAGPQAGTDLAWQAPIRPGRADEWPTFRGNITRSGSTTCRVPARLGRLWRAPVGGALSAPVVADGKLLIASKDAQVLHCLDAAGGKELWRFAAGGRVDSPPTVHDGLCVFGCGDGSVYCLNVADGELAWRFRAGPIDRRVVGDSRLESVWPISGSVLVQDGLAYFAAGRSSYLDGGIRLFGLDLYTGRKLHETTVSAVPVYPGRKDATVESVGALPDVLVSDGRTLNMRHLQFGMDLKPRDKAQLRTLCATTGLLEDLWAHRQNWCLGYPGQVGSTAVAPGLTTRQKASPRPMGKLIAFDADLAYAVRSRYTWLKHDRTMWPESHDGHLHQKYARYKAENFPIGVVISALRNGAGGGLSAQKRRGKGQDKAQRPALEAWSIEEPIQPRAMVLAGDALFLAGWRDAVAIREGTGRPLDPANPDPRPAFLRAVSPADGSRTAEYELDCEPVFDGMAAAYGRLYVALKDGTVLCMGAKD